MIAIIETVKTFIDLRSRWWIIMILIGMTLIGMILIGRSSSIVNIWSVRDRLSDLSFGTQELPVIRAPSAPYKTDYDPSDDLSLQTQQLMINSVIYQKLSSDPVSEAEIILGPDPEVPLSKPFGLR